MKKAQNVGQIFTYILAILIIGMILVFGYKFVDKIINSSDEVAIAQFKKSLEASIKTISNDYGSMESEEFGIGGEFRGVCFLNNYDGDFTVSSMDDLAKDYPLIADTIDYSDTTNPKASYNVFLIRRDNRVEGQYSLGKTVVGTNAIPYKCINLRGGVLSIKIEGKGDHVVIS